MRVAICDGSSVVECLLPPPKAKAFRRISLNAKLLTDKEEKNIMYFTYVLRCVDNKRGRVEFYTGSSKTLPNRVQDHESKSVRTTKSFDNVELVYYEACLNKADAIKRENQL